MMAYYSLIGLLIQGLIVNILFASSPVEGQNMKEIRITINANGVTLEQAFQIIEKKTDFKFVFFEEGLPLNEKVSLNINDESLYDMLETIAKDCGLSFSRVNNQIVVKKAKTPDETPVTVIESGSVKGYVTDAATKEYLEAVTVAIKGSTMGSMTNKKGYYEISNIKPGKYTLVASYVGYGSVEKAITIIDNKTIEVDFQLEQKDVDMNEVLVTASTVLPTPVKKLPNAITVVTPREIENINAPTAADLIRLTVPGAVYTQEGAGTIYGSFSVRGVSSVSGSASTMKVYVDGVECSDPAYMTYLDPTTIEHMEVIPGPQASTIYGAGAISGVIQIFTKHGIAGDVKLSGKAGLTSVDNKYVGDNHPLGKEMELSASGGYSFMTYNVGIHYRTEAQWLNLFEQNNLGLTGSSNFTVGNLSGTLSLNLTKLDGSAGDNPYYKQLEAYGFSYSASATTSQTNYETYGLTLNYKTTENWTSNLIVGYNNVQMKYADRTATSGLYSVTDSKTQRYTAAFNSSYQMKFSEILASSLTLGADWTQYSHPYFSGEVADRNSYDFVDSDPGYVINSGFFGQTQVSLFDFIFLTGGLRADKNPSGATNAYTWSPRLGLSSVYEVEKWMVKGRVSWGQSVNIPDASAVSGSIGSYYIILPNSELKSEIQKGWEIGADLYYSNILSVGLTYFNQKPTNLIEMVNLGFTSDGLYQYQYQNVGEVKNEGFEVKIVAHPLDWLTINLNYGQTKSNITQLGSNYTGTNEVGDELLGLPKYTLSLNFEITPIEGTSVTISGFQFGEWKGQDLFNLYKDIYSGNYYNYLYHPEVYKIKYSAYTKINLGVTQKITKFVSAYIQVNNLTNTDKFERINIIATQPRTIIMGIKFAGLTL